MPTLLTGANVHTLDPAHPHATGILIDAGRIAAVGDDAQLRATTSGADIIDCRGQTVLPGLVDAHIHATMYADSLAEVDLRQVRSLPDAVEAVRTHAASLPPGVWVTGGRWDCNTWEIPGQPDRELLDAALPDRPVALWSIDYHTLWCNGAALRAAGIDEHTPSPRGGEIVRDADGQATGILREDAATIVERLVPAPPIEMRMQRMRTAQRQWLSEGLTGIHDIDGQVSSGTWAALREQGIGAGGGQLMRVVKYLRLDELDWAKGIAWRTGDGDEWFTRGGLKLFSDGALGSQTSYMSSPYPGTCDHYGMEIASEDVLCEQITDALMSGLSLAIHAIGDQANHHVLSAFARTRSVSREAERIYSRRLRHRIEHVQFVQPDDIARFAELGIVASMQPRHCISDLHLLEALRPDPQLAAYAWGEMAAAGVPVAFGSDGPVEPSDPWAAIYAAMTRADISGDPSTAFQPHRRISAYAAIEAHTAGAAYAAGREKQSGRIMPGMDADLIVVDTDPITGHAGSDGVTGRCESEEALFEHACAVRDLQVDLSIVNGEVAFAR